jgi:UDP-N-acetylmuramoyl-L-alanyl-D-glutamate--2,6-diaminopimelate ligase
MATSPDPRPAAPLEPAAARPLRELLREVPVVAVAGDLAVRIAHLTHDSRRVVPGGLFVAYQGVYQDVHRFIPDALARGAAAVVVEHPPDELQAELGLPAPLPATFVQVADARWARAHIAAALWGHPSRSMTVVGVTGTDGKTTTCTLIHAMLRAAGHAAGLVSTIEARLGDGTLDTGLHVTTPEPEDLQAYLARMRSAGLDTAVLEVTSHGLAQHRVAAIAFDVAVVTNITHEALEFHGTFEAYREAKAQLLHALAGGAPAARTPGKAGTAVLNAGDPSFERLAAIPVARRLTYSLTGEADFRAEDIRHSHRGLSFQALTPLGRLAVQSPLLGHTNVANILAALAASSALGVGRPAWEAGIAAVRGIPGRMEQVNAGQPYQAIVDFAHTPNALRQALGTARELTGPTGRVIAVFGCAGLRDPAKRAWMGQVAGQLADRVFLTAEDPRTESLPAILQAIAGGVAQAGGVANETYWLVPDRAEAIRRACALARPADVVLVTGKGHEQSLCFGEVEYAWDDRAAVRAAIAGEPYGFLPTAG